MISLDFQNLNSDDYKSLEKAILAGVSTSSPIVGDFEKVIAEYLNVKPGNVLVVNSGTSALHLALLGCRVKPEDEVILPVLTFAATANAVKYIGAKIKFCDVDEDTWDINPNEIDRLMNDRLIGVVYVDLYGVPVNGIEILDKIEKYRIFVIADSSESLGSIHRKNYLTRTGVEDFSCFSFNGNKIITTGGGGLIVGPENPINYLRGLSCQGRRYYGSGYDELHSYVGYNYRMPGLNAALGLSQLHRLPYFLERKRRIHAIYETELSDILQFQKATKGTFPNWWYTAALLPEGRHVPTFQSQLQAEGIPTRRVFRPLNESPAFIDRESYPVAEMIFRRGICLPCSTLMTDSETSKVCSTIRRLL